MNHDEIAALDWKDWRMQFHVNRRQFLKGFSGGIAIAVSLRDARAAEEPSRLKTGPTQTPQDFNAYLTIDENGHVSCFTGKIEMGQGVETSQAQLVADELDVRLSAVEVVMGDTDRCPFDQGTWGSLTTRVFGPVLRAAAAEVRAVLLELASETLKLDKAKLSVVEGEVFDSQNPTRRVSYGQLAHGQKIARHLTLKPQLKTRAQMHVMGSPTLRRDGHDKVTGKAKYAADIRLPHMLYASILRPPAHGATLKRVDFGAAKQIAGTEIVHDGDFVAALHELPDMAERALSLMQADWDVPASTLDEKTIYEHLLKVAPTPSTLDSGGDLSKGRKQSKQSFESTYLNAYVAHAPMETHAALAQFVGEKVTIWASTQSPFGLQREAAEMLGVQTKNVRVMTPYLGGGFGGKSRNLQALEAVRLARKLGRPVQVAWTRREEFFYDSFRPAAIVKIQSGIDRAGHVSFWDYDVMYAGERGAPQFYDFAHHRTIVHGGGWQAPKGAHPFATGAWRAPGNNTNSFARESQIDIMATAAGVDPVEFRLQHLKEPRLIAALKAAADRFGWKPARAPSRRGFGVACGTDAGTFVATMAEVEVSDDGIVRVKRVVCAQDMGFVVNPEGAKIQTEGGITMGLGYALSEEIRFQGGDISDNNFGTYELPRFSDTPKIESVFMDSALPSQGGGEPAIIVMGAVIANATFDATGARVRELPMTPSLVKAAMQKL